jgi:deoxyribodipyrimidine photo-lyase
MPAPRDLPPPFDLGRLLPPERLRLHRRGPRGEGPVVAWLRRSHRTLDNPTLEAALALAARLERSLLVVAPLDTSEPGLTERTAHFALQGLRDLRDALRRRGVGIVVPVGDAVATLGLVARDAAALVVDRGYLRAEREGLASLVATLERDVLEVEGAVVVPVEVAYPKPAYMARVLRGPLSRLAERFGEGAPEVAVARPWQGSAPTLPAGVVDVTDALEDPVALLARRAIDPRARPTERVGGERAALAALDRFLAAGLRRYVEDRRLPHRASTSGLGPYLRFGHVSPGHVLRAVAAAEAPAEAREAFVEELLVRRELAANHAHATPDYDRWSGLPRWARATLLAHASDPRAHYYDRAAFERAATHDPVWNAAMTELRESGTLHNYMRMYWGKMLLEWSADPEEAFEVALDLNDTYLLDGRDPNSYAGVGWIFGLHDRPWPERPIYGTVRSMALSGLRRKSDPDAYVADVQARFGATAGGAVRG